MAAHSFSPTYGRMIHYLFNGTTLNESLKGELKSGLACAAEFPPGRIGGELADRSSDQADEPGSAPKRRALPQLKFAGNCTIVHCSRSSGCVRPPRARPRHRSLGPCRAADIQHESSERS